MRLLIASLLIAAVVAIVPVVPPAQSGPGRLENIVVAPGLPRQHSVSMRHIYTQAVAPAGFPTWGQPLEAQYQLPMSARVLYLFYNNERAAGAGSALEAIHNAANTGIVSPVGDSIGVNTLRFDFDQAFPAGTTLTVTYQQPNLDINPFGCAGGVGGNCRCISSNSLRQYLTAPANVQTVGLPAGATTGNAFIVPDVGRVSTTYFEHAPFAGQNPFLRTFRRLCTTINRAGGVATDSIFDTGAFVAVVLPCFPTITGLPAAIAAAQPTDFNCASRATSTIAVDSNNNRLTAANAGTLGGFSTKTGAISFTVTDLPVETGEIDGETLAMRRDRLQRTTCCGSNEVVRDFTVFQPGVCINPARTACCGRRPFQRSDEQCCDRMSSSVRQVTQACPCLAVSSDTQQCQRNSANLFDATGRDQAGMNQPVTGTDTCCRITKFGPGNPVELIQAYSFCVSADINAVRKCCSDGNVYDSSAQQCCPINGIQSANIPCPCGATTDCPARQACCTQLFPIPSPRDQPISTCNRFAAYPRFSRRVGATLNPGGVDFSLDDVIDTAPIPRESLRCAGTCFSLDYQMCCNGRVCSSALERCCNDTCCNRYTSGCLDGRRPGSLTSRFNPRDWSVYYETCASIGALNGRKAFFVFILPTFMLFVTLLSLALVAVLARRATEHIFEMTERLIVALAVIETFLCCAFYFSPLYKNTVAVAFVSLAAILIAVARKTSASLFLVFLTFFMILYLIDPFSGNIWLGVPSHVPIRGAPLASSILGAVIILFTSGNAACTQYYNRWFEVDRTLVDYARHYNPLDTTWGFCSREWITTLAVFAILLIVIMLLLLLLAIFSFVKKIAVKHVEPIELEVIPEPGPFY